MLNNFDRSFALVMKSEGGFTDDEKDPGNKLPDGRKGCTNHGVTQAAWESYLGRKVSRQEMLDLTTEGVKPFYKKMYWDTCKCDRLPAGVDYLVFDLSVNGGASRGSKTLQSAVGAFADGAIGEKTLAAVGEISANEIVEKFTKEKVAFYKSLNNPRFEKGWLNRAAETRANALAMIA
jgi:lysozyme family protein